MADQLLFISFDQCRPGKFQPRTQFEKEALEQLIQSIAAIGIQQPLTVRQLKNPERLVRYEIVSGERRWRAAQALG
ncbi:MAG: ParB/RepB/Spo0J family partition protein, partial [Gammaproteobacteria bacterium]